ncbi:MAG: histidine kinase [Bacteroidota bacterium]
MDTIKGLRNFMTDHMQHHPFIFSNELKYRLGRHAAFWGFWWIFQAFLYSFIPAANGNDYWESLQISVLESFIFMLCHLFLGCTLMYFVIPRFLLKQRYWATALWTAIMFIATAFLSTFLGKYIIGPVRHYLAAAGYIHANFERSHALVYQSLLAGLRGGITIGGIAAAIKLMKYWYIKEQRNLQLQKENVASQLQLLKAQVHPHFLFNTLNNIYFYTQDTAPVAAQLITGLSDILRFILYESSQPLVALSKELKLMKDYINLEQIRYGNRLDIHIDIPEKTNDLYISPLLMLPLIENCFKHGASNMLEQPWISLQITLQNKQIQMKLLNGKTNKERKEDHSSGIGIQNVQKRLELLYPGKHELAITNEEDVFIVNLKIELEKNPKPAVKLTHLLAESVYD